MKKLLILIVILVTAGLLPAAVYATQSSAAPVAAGPATQRPIEDFVDQQGTFCFPDGEGGCLLFVPPVENFWGWTEPDPDNPGEVVRAISVDYAGLADDYLGGTLGTEFSGSVTERPLEDGRVEVHVRLRTKNALTWVVQGGDFAGGPLLFGARAPEVEAGAEPALGDSFLHLVFINSAPGALLPDLIQLFVAPEEGQEPPSFMAFTATAKGPLREAFGVPDGTPGVAQVTQTGLLKFLDPSQPPPDQAAVADGFPVEFIKLKVVGSPNND